MISLSLLLAAFLPVIPQPSSWTPSNEQPYNVSEDRVRWEIVSDRGLGDEGYEMRISPTGILAVAESETGLRWARQTYAQLASRGGTIPSGTIRDRPKYLVRSLMIDVGRTFIELDFLRQLVKDMAYYKFNNLHIHLNDDGARMFCTNGYHAFRLECETYPDLTAKDGHYTKAEFRAFIKEAAAQGVTVLPEIDTPSHAGCFRGVKALAEKGVDGIDLKRMDVVCPFMEKLFAEYLDGDDPVFAGKYVHVGTDEYLGDGELFRKYADWMFKMVRRHGHEPQAWGALSHRPGKTPVLADGDIVMDIWHGPYYDPREALKAGYKIISVPADPLYIVPASGYYNDYLDLGWIYAHWEPCNVGGAYFPFDIPPDHPQLLGGKFAVWNDISGNGISDDDIFDRVFPALQVLGQKLWSGATGQSYDDFKRHEINYPGNWVDAVNLIRKLDRGEG
jgi:hexosaminidase